ncbi:MAG: hypothetical protein AAGD18_03530 [Actinomycetota bacterium]
MNDADATRIIRPGQQSGSPPADEERGQLTDELIATSIWDDDMLARAGIPIDQAPIVSIGGGLGSFALVDTLRIAGVDTSSIRVITNLDRPSDTYRWLAGNSQIPEGERLRSDAGSVMDNVWGFPSYAWRESRTASSLSKRLAPLWNVLAEPFGIDYWTPRAGDVYDGVDREAVRISWADMVTKGLVRMVRRHRGGGFVTLYTPDGATPGQRRAIRSQHVHVAVGYPGLKFLPDLQAYREAHSDFSRVVNAYEPHDHVYEELRRSPGTVLVRGSGIVGSRVLQRLLDDRDAGLADTTVIHLFRNYVDSPQGEKITYRRPGGDGFAYQGFNFPKSAWGGQLKVKLEELEGPERADLIRTMGGTNTPKRKSWQVQIKRARSHDAYRQIVGQVSEVRQGPNQTVVTEVDTQNGRLELPANFIIDATGLEADIGEHRVLADLLEHSGANRNAYGRLDVAPSFEVRGTRSDRGRCYATGSITLGGYYAGVDSFLGLQYAALQIADDLAAAGSVPRIGPRRSVGEWWRRMRDRPPAPGTSTGAAS